MGQQHFECKNISGLVDALEHAKSFILENERGAFDILDIKPRRDTITKIDKAIRDYTPPKPKPSLCHLCETRDAEIIPARSLLADSSIEICHRCQGLLTSPLLKKAPTDTAPVPAGVYLPPNPEDTP